MERQSAFQLIAPLFASIVAILVFVKPLLAVYFVLLAVMVYLTWRHPTLVLTLVFIAAPFQKNISGSSRDEYGTGIAFSIAELLFASALPGFLLNQILSRRRILFGPTIPFTLAYLGCCIVSSASTWHGDWSWISIAQMLIYLVLVVMVFATYPPNSQALLKICRTAVAVAVPLALLAIVGGMSLLGLNKNGLGSSLSAALLICMELWFAEKDPQRKGWLGGALATIALGLLFTLSRGSWLGALGGLIVITTLRREFRLMVRAGVIVLILFPIFWNFLPQEKRDYAFNFDQKNYNINARYKMIDFARTTFEAHPILGGGVGIRKEVDATNVFWFTLAETGVVGLVTFVLLQASCYRMIWVTRRRVPPSNPLYSVLSIAGALVTSRLMHGMVDHYWGRGESMMVWASVGMATRVYYESQGVSVRRSPTVRKLVPRLRLAAAGVDTGAGAAGGASTRTSEATGSHL